MLFLSLVWINEFDVDFTAYSMGTYNLPEFVESDLDKLWYKHDDKTASVA